MHRLFAFGWLGGFLAVVLSVLLVAGSARAQEPPAPPPAAASPTGPDSRDDETWLLYHEAFRLLAAGDRAAALDRLKKITAGDPAHPAARAAAALVQIVQAAGPPPAQPAAPAPAAAPRAAAPPAQPARLAPAPPDAEAPPRTFGPGEPRSKGARAELIVFQTLHGIAAGAELCLIVECSGVRSHALSLMAGGGLGLGLSIGLSAGGVTPGQVELLDTGTLWGAWNGISLAIIAGQDGGSPSFFRTVLLGQGGGLALGGLLWYPLRPTAGQVSLASTFGAWSTVVTLLALGAADTGAGEKAIWSTLLTAGDLGLLVGAIAARDSSISRGRTLLIDAGGVLGLLLGALFASSAKTTQTVAITSLIGTSIGLGVAIGATRDWDLPDPGVRLTATPLPGGGMTAGLGGTF
jgi:hypothetical protein